MLLILSWSYLIVLLLVALSVLPRFSQLDKATRTICLLIGLGVITEAAALVSGRIWKTNYLVYNTSFYVYFLLMMLYFHQSNPALKRWRFLHVFVPAILLMGIISIFYLPSHKSSLNTVFLALKCCSVAALSLFAITTLYRHNKDLATWPRRVHFWIPFILLFQQSTAICSWLSYQHLIEVNTSIRVASHYIIILINLFTYLCYALLIYRYPKLDSAYV